MNLIGFNGRMGSGKSTAIQALKYATEGVCQVHLVKFAQPLYDLQEAAYKRIESVYKRPESFIKDRKLLQWLGTEWGRDGISKTLWVDIWTAEVRRLNAAHPNDLIVCDDARFDNEAETIRSLGGLVVSINCNRTDERIDTKAGIVSHSSEAGINASLVDYTINNDGTREEFTQTVIDLYNKTKRK